MPLPPLYPIIDFSSFAAKPDPIVAIVSYAEELLRAGVKLIQLRDKSSAQLGPISGTCRFLSCARELRRVTMGKATLIINDRVDLCLASEADGVHLGQDDLSPTAARKILDMPYSIAHSLGQLMRQPVEFSHVENLVPPAQTRAFEREFHRLRRHMFEQLQSKSHLSGEKPGGVDAAAIDQRKLIGFSTHNPAQVREADALPVDYIAIGPVFATVSKANPDPVVGVDGVRQARQVTSKPLVAIGGITRLNCRQVKEAGADSVAVISDLLESPGKAVADFLRVLG
jgi:thiamine monophosphate synthase